MCLKYPSKEIAIKTLQESEKLNPGLWKEHSEYVALACKNISQKCKNLNSDKAYVLGLLHDIGRRVGIVSEYHMIAGYHYCMNMGWDDVAKICVTHSFMLQDINTSIGSWDVSESDYILTKHIINSSIYDDYDLLVQLCDALALPSGFCLLEKRFVDVTLRYGFNEYTIKRWEKTFEIKTYFESLMGCSIYSVLPNVKENTFSL
ncbi:HDOD domain-containing protein [Clostridium botulinum]|nr:HDOD domain-containing protein [Clostridium botulinum]